MQVKRTLLAKINGLDEVDSLALRCQSSPSREILQNPRLCSPAVRSTVRCNDQLGHFSRQWELKFSSNHAGYCQIFVKCFPSQCISTYLYLYLFKLIFRGLAKNLKAVSRETKYPPIS